MIRINVFLYRVIHIALLQSPLQPLSASEESHAYILLHYSRAIHKLHILCELNAGRTGARVACLLWYT